MHAYPIQNVGGYHMPYGAHRMQQGARWQAGGPPGTVIHGYTLGDEICEGSYGIVRKAVRQSESGRVVYAIKVVQASRFSESECTLQRSFEHVNILRVLEKFEQDGLVFIVLEYCAGGDLFDFVQRARSPLSEQTARDIFVQMLAAVGLLHSKGVCHHDVKLENFLLHGGEKKHTLKLCDFGAAEQLPATGMTQRYKGEVSAPEKARKGSTYNGYMADVFQLGKSLHELLFKLNAPAPSGALNPHKLQRSVSKSATDLMLNLLNPNPSARLTLQQVLQHQWVTGGEPRIPGKAPAAAPATRDQAKPLLAKPSSRRSSAASRGSKDSKDTSSPVEVAQPKQRNTPTPELSLPTEEGDGRGLDRMALRIAADFGAAVVAKELRADHAAPGGGAIHPPHGRRGLPASPSAANPPRAKYRGHPAPSQQLGRPGPKMHGFVGMHPQHQAFGRM
eukprot:NODE_1020_length_1507_cov_129.789855_g1009_i0.p1 GENE.NODE_1020_length_1507_cov_129.789855_g1009_i0~~NODE_1020_length_1507_cov_129.789855_g1009_i0.p1  ORF type:complete len:448 (+),score=49.19 NODE_1020_length_1507_cov_129.789855_g1009_i0:76-1419(+)